MSSREYVLGADIGTSGCKTIIFDTAGNFVGTEFKPCKTTVPQVNWAEQDPDEWYSAFSETTKTLLKRHGVDGKEIVSIGIDGMMNSGTFLDSSCKPVRSCIIWMDQRSIPLLGEMSERLGAREGGERRRVGAISMLSKIYWVMKNQPEIWDRTRFVVSPKDYLVYRLTTSLQSDLSDASSTGMFDTKTLNWSVNTCTALDIDMERLPSLVPSVTVVGKTSVKAAEETDISEGVKVVAGCNDGTADALSGGVVDIPDTMFRLGTTGAIHMVSNVNAHMVHCVPNRWLAHTTFPFGLPHKWFHETFYENEVKESSRGSNAYKLVEEKAKTIPLGSEGLLFQPYLLPNSENLRGGFLGIGLQHRREHFARAMLEGIAFSLKDTFMPFLKISPNIKSVRIIGGGAKSRLLVQIICDVMGFEGAVPLLQDASVGAALLGGIGSGAFSSVDDAVEKCVRIEYTAKPSPKNHEEYERLFTAFMEMKRDLGKKYEFWNAVRGQQD